MDGGVGTFLSSGPQLSHPSEVDDRWVKLARDNQARIQVPTLRNVDKRPDPSFVKAYTHNGYFTSLKTIVHYYNTRDVLPRCKPNDPGEGTTCWPAPESTDNMNTKFMGRLGLSDAEEDALVALTTASCLAEMCRILLGSERPFCCMCSRQLMALSGHAADIRVEFVSENLGHLDEVGDRRRCHLSHGLSSVHLHRRFREPGPCGHAYSRVHRSPAQWRKRAHTARFSRSGRPTGTVGQRRHLREIPRYRGISSAVRFRMR